MTVSAWCFGNDWLQKWFLSTSRASTKNEWNGMACRAPAQQSKLSKTTSTSWTRNSGQSCFAQIISIKLTGYWKQISSSLSLTRTHKLTHARMHTGMNTHKHTCTCMHTHTHAGTHTHIHTCMHTHTHTHMHTQTQLLYSTHIPSHSPSHS